MEWLRLIKKISEPVSVSGFSGERKWFPLSLSLPLSLSHALMHSCTHSHSLFLKWHIAPASAIFLTMNDFPSVRSKSKMVVYGKKREKEEFSTKHSSSSSLFLPALGHTHPRHRWNECNGANCEAEAAAVAGVAHVKSNGALIRARK